MENMDLIQFGSPNGCVNTSLKSSFSNSPGNNPYDMLWNVAQSFSDNVTKESLGGSPFQLFEKSLSDIDTFFNCTSGRESFGIAAVDDFAKESLGILKIDVLNSTMDDLNFNISPEMFTNSFATNKTIDKSFLNTAFLYPTYCDSKSYLSNSSLFSSYTLDFNSGSLEGSQFSKIYSITSSQSSGNSDALCTTKNKLNYAFVNSITASLHQNEHEARLRLFSLPALNKVKDTIDNLLSKSENDVDTKLLDSCEPFKDDVDNAFNDSVFIEANHFVSKLADGSITSTKCFEDNLLDCTSPPEFDEDIETYLPAEIDNENVFKSIDKLVPPSDNQNNMITIYDCHIKCDDFIPESHKSCVYQNVSKEQTSLELKHNLSNRFKRRSSSSSSTTSRDANELLHNLSEIIKNENRDMKQNLEGQKLLFGLADILCSNASLRRPNDSLDDSGHSSIEHEEQQVEDDHNTYEILDLRIASKSTDNDKVLDLSLKSKRFTKSLSFPTPKTVPSTLQNNAKTCSTVSPSSLDLNKVNSLAGVKLKPKRVDENVVLKKGPLKAVIPVGNMSKHSNYGRKTSAVSVTPPKMENTHSTLFKAKRTSTPIMEQKLKPMAQSTPDGNSPELDKSSPYNSSKVLIKPKSYSPVSSQLPRKLNSNKSSPLGSAANLPNCPSSESATLTRRHSESELKRNNPSVVLKRSYSIGKSSKLSTSYTEKVKPNILTKNKVLLKNPAGTGIQASSVLQEKNCSSISKMKPFNFLSKLKKTKMNKENCTDN